MKTEMVLQQQRAFHSKQKRWFCIIVERERERGERREREVILINGISVRDEKVGNFPVRLLVILVKLSKLVEKKKVLVKQLSDMNSEAERANLLSDTYHFTFKVS